VGKRRKNKPRAAKQRPNMTANEQLIADMMVKVRKRGNPKDYVVLTGLRMIDFFGSYDIKPPSQSDGVKGVVLVHKRNLHRILGDEVASKFWNRKTGTRVPIHRDGTGNAPAAREQSAQGNSQ
jgi:hypothetical protein